MRSEIWVLLVWLAPCVPVALFGWWRASIVRTLAAEAWTVIGSAVTLVLVGFSVIGDCAEDVIGPVPGNPCHAAKSQGMMLSLAFGFAILVAGNWLIFRGSRK
jgi:hypothetical protein